MKAPRIPIEHTAAEARAQLEAEHAIEYIDSILGGATRATCSCGWRSPWLTTGWVAQEAAGRHWIAYVEHPLENRARYAIYRVDGVFLRWALLDRQSGEVTRWLDRDECVRAFSRLLVQEASR